MFGFHNQRVDQMGLLHRRRFTIPAASSLRHLAVMAAVVVVSVLSLSSNAAAQGSNIKGKVVADIPVRRKALSGVIVSLSGDRLAGKKLQSISDEEGRYEFAGLVAGDYLVAVDLTGFKAYEQNISLQIEATV